MRIYFGFPLPRWAWLLSLLLGCSCAQATGLPQGRHKVQVSDPVLASQIVAQGGRFIADYGSYQLYETTQVPPGLATNPHAEVRDEYNVIALNAAPLDTTKAEVKALRKAVTAFAGKRLHLVQFAGPVQPAWREALTAAGVQIVAYVPHNAYLVYGQAADLSRVQALAASAPHIQWEGPYRDDYKLHPTARSVDAKGKARQIGTDTFAVQLVADASANPATLALLDRLKLAPLARRHAVLQYLNLVVRLNAADLQLVAAQADVVSIQPYFPRKKLCERQDQILAGNLSGTVPTGPGYLAWLASKGFTQAQFTASGFAVDVTDSGLDIGTTAPNHPGLYVSGDLTNSSRVLYNRLEGTPNAGSTLAGCDGHGTLNAHIVGGYNDLAGFPHTDGEGFHYGLGVCPFVPLGSSVVFDPNTFTSPNYDNLQSEAYQSGARISNNSWGASTLGDYDVDAQNYDALVRDAQPAGSTFATPGNQEMVIVFAAGNDGPGSQTVGSPGTAKNVISVGAAENVQPIGGKDGSSIGDTQADSAEDIPYFSSRGPCSDGRHKPDLVAPGTHVSGGVAQAANAATNGTAIPCFDGEGVSGGVGGSKFFPAGQQFYTASSGTSHSTPAVSGGCALVRQYFINQHAAPPSPAMTKAYLLNSARYLTGNSARDTLWSDTQGLGEMDLGMALDGTPRLVRDQLPADLFTRSGQLRAFAGTIADTNRPFRVTLAWTDAPGSTTGKAYNNNLDLTVTVGGTTYKGNVFSGPDSVPGGSADAQNNVESVFLPAGLSGNFVVQVSAANINSDGVPNNSSPLDQDFALVAYNATASALPVIEGEDSALEAETCYPESGAIDPGETVVVSFALRNVGTADTTNLVATLQSSGGVIALSEAQSYGYLPAGGLAASRAFAFTAQGTCGGTNTATLQLQDGGADLGSVSFTLPLGKPVQPLIESFEAVTVPALPQGWTRAVTGGGTLWVTANNKSDSAPNSAFADEPLTPGVSELVTPPIPIRSAAAQLTFRNNYNLEADDLDVSKGYDGGVLEIKIGDSAFTDILAAGGSFVRGGYTRTIDITDDNPLDGRQSWGGSSGGFIDTVVNLPAAAAGQSIQLKWRLGTDTANGFGGSGWYLDTITLVDGYTCCVPGASAPIITTQPVNQRVAVGADTAFFVTTAGTSPIGYQWRFNGTNLPGAIVNPLSLTNVQTSDMGTYSVLVTNVAGAVTSTVATLTVLVPPAITGVNLAGTTNLTLSFSSSVGSIYTLEYKEALTNGPWMPIMPSVFGTGRMLLLQDTNALVPSRFYRLRVE